MAVDPIGETPELEPVLDAPTPGGSSPLVPPETQAPTGFGGPTPGIQPAMPSSPVTISRSSPKPKLSPEMRAAAAPLMESPASAWTDQNYDDLDLMLATSFPGIAAETVANVSKVIIAAGDPSITQLSTEKFVRQVGLTTEGMFEERALMGMLGAVGDDEAFTQAAYDTYLETGGVARDASTVLAGQKSQQFWFDNTFLESGDVRNRITTGAAPIVFAKARQAALDNGFVLRQDDALVAEVNGLRGKSGVIVVQDGQLAIQFNDEAKDKPSASVLVYLEPGTVIETREDALLAYLLADKGVMHALSPTSANVPGRQNIIGVMIEGFDDVWAGVERNGFGTFMEGVKDSNVAVDELMRSPSRRRNPSREQEEAVAASIREKETRAAVERSIRTDSIVAISQQIAANNPDAPIGNVVTAGIAAFDSAPDELKEAQVVARIEDLEAAATAKTEQQSMLGRILEEDVAPGVLGVLQAYESAIHIVGMSVLDLGNNGILELGREVNEKGIGALFDPESLAKLAPVDAQFLQEQFQNVREEGLPKAFMAYGDSLADIGTIANYYGIDEDSAWASWVNLGASILFDPITWATLGGAASWNALKKGVFTAAGADRIIGSRPILSAVRNVVVNDSARSIPLMIEGGMSSRAGARLAMIARTTYKTRAEKIAAMELALDIIKHELPGYGGFWIPAGPARALRRKTTTGLASLAGIAPKDPQAMGFLQAILVRGSKARFAQINERQWLGDMLGRVEIRRLNNVEGFADDIDFFTELYTAYREGDGAIAILQGKVQKLRQEMVDISGGLTDDVRQIPTLRRTVTGWNDSIRSLDERIAKMSPDDPLRAGIEEARQTAITNRDEIEALLRGYDGGVSIGPSGYTNLPGNPYDSYTQEIRRRQNLVSRYEAQMLELGTGSRDRSVLEHAVHKYMDDWAEEWGVPLLKDVDGNLVTHPMFPDLNLRDWDGILGEGSTASWQDQVANLTPFGRDAENLKKLGFGPQAGTTPLPVDMNTFLAWHAMTRTKAGVKAWEYFLRHPGWKQAGDQLQSVWALQVLFGPRIAFRSHMDEVVRFYEDSGLNVDLLKSTTPGRLTGEVGAPARGFARDEMDTFVAPGKAEWQMVDPSKKRQWVAAERWVNGQIVSDPLFQAYARSFTNGADDVARRALWERWWNDTGVHLAKTSTINGDPITARGAYDIMEGSFNRWLAQVREAPRRGRISRKEIRDDMLRAAASGSDEGVEWGEKTWRQLPPVPGEQVSRAGISNPVESGFSLLFGKPQSRRGSVFFDHYYNWAYNNYQGAFKDKIITADWLLENGHATSRIHAQELMNQAHRSHVVRDLINESGMVLNTDLKNAAMQWAGSAADDMMYTFGATSVLGQKMARIYPFGRAQVDYYQWWWKKLTQPTQWGIPGTGISGQAPVLGGAARMASLPAVGANVRLIDRMAHLAALSEPGEQPGARTPAGLVNNFSFLPTAIDEQVLIETTPNFGPMPSWLLNAPLDDVIPGWADMRNAVQELHPAHRIFTNPSEDPVEWLLSFRDALFPKGGLTVRNTVAALNDLTAYAVAMMTHGYDPSKPLTDEQQRNVNKTAAAWILQSSQGAWRADYIQLDQAEWLNENALTTSPEDLNRMDAESELITEWAFRNDQASVSALGEDAADFFAKIVGVPEYAGSDFKYVQEMLLVGDDGWTDLWFESGSIGDEKRDAILAGYELVKSGSTEAKDLLTYADLVLDTIYHFLSDEERTEFLAKNPGMHINMVSSYEVYPSLVPADARDAVQGYRIRSDLPISRAQEVRKQGKEGGWLKLRDSMDVRMDSLYSAHRSFRAYLVDIYEDATGLAYGTNMAGEGDERANIDQFAATLTPEWWQHHGEWLESTGVFQLPSNIKAALVAGQDADINTAELKEITRIATKAYAYRLDISTATESKLTRIGQNTTPKSNLVYEMAKVPGFDRADFDQSQDLSYYGSGLMEDFQDALAAGQEYEGWESFEDWEYDTVSFEVETTDEFGEKIIEVKTYSRENLRSRFRTAITMSQMEEGDPYRFTENNYMSEIYGRELGELYWEPPSPPTLTETVAYHETTPDKITVVDGDTLKIEGEDAPVYVRLIGLNTPERTQPGYGAAYRGIADLIDGADTVQLVVFDPDIYGLKTSSLTREGGATGPIVHRDRLLVWLYINGIPVFDPDEFSPTNIRGVETGGSVPDYRTLYENAGGS